MFNIGNINRKTEMFLFDIFIAINKIKYVVKDFDNSDDLLHSFKDWDTVIREFEIIGEASKYLLKNNLLDNEFRKIVDFRNRITHNYFGIDPEIVFHISKYELDDFLKVINKLINKIDNSLKNELIESFIEDNKYLDFIVKELKKLNKGDI